MEEYKLEQLDWNREEYTSYSDTNKRLLWKIKDEELYTVDNKGNNVLLNEIFTSKEISELKFHKKSNISLKDVREIKKCVIVTRDMTIYIKNGDALLGKDNQIIDLLSNYNNDLYNEDNAKKDIILVYDIEKFSYNIEEILKEEPIFDLYVGEKYSTPRDFIVKINGVDWCLINNIESDVLILINKLNSRNKLLKISCDKMLNTETRKNILESYKKNEDYTLNTKDLSKIKEDILLNEIESSKALAAKDYIKIILENDFEFILNFIKDIDNEKLLSCVIKKETNCTDYIAQKVSRLFYSTDDLLSEDMFSEDITNYINKLKSENNQKCNMVIKEDNSELQFSKNVESCNGEPKIFKEEEKYDI